MPILVRRTGTLIEPEKSRVLLRPFTPGDSQRFSRIIHRIMLIPEETIGALLEEISVEFNQRHQVILNLFLDRFEQVRAVTTIDDDVSEQRRLLIGAYFLAEYSLEAAALFNPSIVPHPDQTNLQ